MKALELIKKFHQEEAGQDLVEYALVLVAVGAAVFAANGTLSTALAKAVTGISAKMDTWFA